MNDSLRTKRNGRSPSGNVVTTKYNFCSDYDRSATADGLPSSSSSSSSLYVDHAATTKKTKVNRKRRCPDSLSSQSPCADDESIQSLVRFGQDDAVLYRCQFGHPCTNVNDSHVATHHDERWSSSIDVDNDEHVELVPPFQQATPLEALTGFYVRQDDGRFYCTFNHDCKQKRTGSTSVVDCLQHLFLSAQCGECYYTYQGPERSRAHLGHEDYCSQYPKPPDDDIEPDKVYVHISGDDVSCPMCKEILCEPISLPCGHTFCRVCLYRCFHARTYEKVCPLCRAQCVRIVAQIAPSNVLIKAFVEQAYPKAYHRRHEEIKNIMEQWPAPLFIYFSSHFILPFQCVTITFTEKRYIEMIRRLDKSNEPAQERAFLLLPPAQMKRGDIGIVVVIEKVSWNSGESEATCRVRADRRCKVMDCWLTDVVDGLHSAQIEPFGDAATPDTNTATLEPRPATSVTTAATSSATQTQTVTTLMTTIIDCMSKADVASNGLFTGRTNIGKAPLDNPVEMSWWIFRALAFDGAGLQARVPIFLTSSILHSRDPLWRLQVAVQLLQQLLTKLNDPRCAAAKANDRNNQSTDSSTQSSSSVESSMYTHQLPE